MVPDARTREGKEHEVLNRIRRCPNGIAYWCLDYPSPIAYATQRLIDSGRIVDVGGRWPWTKWKIKDINAVPKEVNHGVG